MTTRSCSASTTFSSSSSSPPSTSPHWRRYKLRNRKSDEKHSNPILICPLVHFSAEPSKSLKTDKRWEQGKVFECFCEESQLKFPRLTMLLQEALQSEFEFSQSPGHAWKKLRKHWTVVEFVCGATTTPDETVSVLCDMLSSYFRNLGYREKKGDLHLSTDFRPRLECFRDMLVSMKRELPPGASVDPLHNAHVNFVTSLSTSVVVSSRLYVFLDQMNVEVKTIEKNQESEEGDFKSWCIVCVKEASHLKEVFQAIDRVRQEVRTVVSHFHIGPSYCPSNLIERLFDFELDLKVGVVRVYIHSDVDLSKLSSCNKLELLSLTVRPGPQFGDALKTMEELKCFELEHVYLSDEVLKSILEYLQHCSKLQVVSFMACKGRFSSKVRDLVSRLRHLRKLDVTFCVEMDSQSLLEGLSIRHARGVLEELQAAGVPLENRLGVLFWRSADRSMLTLMRTVFRHKDPRRVLDELEAADFRWEDLFGPDFDESRRHDVVDRLMRAVSGGDEFEVIAVLRREGRPYWDSDTFDVRVMYLTVHQLMMYRRYRDDDDEDRVLENLRRRLGAPFEDILRQDESKGEIRDQYPCFRRLRTLNLTSTGLNESDCIKLGRAVSRGQLPALEQLHLSGNALKGQMDRILSAGGAFDSLKLLFLSNSGLESRDLQALCKAVESGKLPSLRLLNLAENPSFSECGELLKKLVEVCVLRYQRFLEINLAECGIPDDVKVALVHACRFRDVTVQFDTDVRRTREAYLSSL